MIRSALPILIGVSVFAYAGSAPLAQGKRPHEWKQFVQVAGQPEPVPAEWVNTPEGKFAHSIKIPNPVPKNSGYRWTMSAKNYFDHLCKQEAGEFVFKTVKDVESLYFARPPARPSDDDLMDRRKLEAPDIERTFQLRKALATERAKIFVNPPWAVYSLVEEPSFTKTPFVQLSGYRQRGPRPVDDLPMNVENVAELKSRFGMTWRGIKRPKDREHAIAGSEWIIFDLTSKEVLAVFRDYALTGNTTNKREGIWWLNAWTCIDPERSARSDRIYKFAIKAISPRRTGVP